MVKTKLAEEGTRTRIVEASAELFRRHGYAGSGLKAIVTSSTSTYGSLFHFFRGGKEELGVVALLSGGEMYRESVEAFYAEGARRFSCQRGAASVTSPCQDQRGMRRPLGTSSAELG